MKDNASKRGKEAIGSHSSRLMVDPIPRLAK